MAHPVAAIRAFAFLLILAVFPAVARPVTVERQASGGAATLRVASYETVEEKFGEAAAPGRAFLVVYAALTWAEEAAPLYLERAEEAFRLRLADGSEASLHPLTGDSLDGWWGTIDLLPGEERLLELVFDVPRDAVPGDLLFGAGDGRIAVPLGEEPSGGGAPAATGEPAREEPVSAAETASGAAVPGTGAEPASTAAEDAAEAGSPSATVPPRLVGDVPAVPPLPSQPRNLVTAEAALAGIVAAEGHDALRDGRTGPGVPVARVAPGSPLTLTFSRPWNVERLRFWLRAPEGSGYGYRLEASADGELWELLVAREDGSYAGRQEFSFPARPMRAVRLVATSVPEGAVALEVEEFEAWSRDHVPAFRDNLAWGGHGGRVVAMDPAPEDLARAGFPLVNGGDDVWEAPAAGPVTVVLGFLDNRAFLIDAVGLRIPDPERAPRRVEIAVSVEGPDRGFSTVGDFPVAVENGRALLPFPPRAARFVRLRFTPSGDEVIRLGDVSVFESRVEGYEPRLPRLVAVESEAPPAARNLALAGNGGRLLAFPELRDGSPDQLHNGEVSWEAPAIDTEEAVFLFRFLGTRRARIDEVRLHLDDIGWPGRLEVQAADAEAGPYETVAEVLLPPTFDQWRSVRFAPVDARFVRIVLAPAPEDGGSEVVDEIAVLEAEASDYLSILEVPFEEQLPLGPNLALSLLGGEITRVGAEEQQQGWSARRLIDGLVGDAYGGARGSVGWTTPPEPTFPVELDLRLAGTRPARIVGVGLNPSFKFKASGALDTDFLGAPGNRPREVEILTSPDGRNWESALRFEMRNRAVLQTFAFPSPREARFVRFRIVSNYGGDRVQLGELEVYEDPVLESPETVLAERPLDIARPELGGAVVGFTSQYGDSTVGRMFDGEPRSFWSPDDGWRFPQRIRLAFAGDAEAEIAALEIVPREGGEPEARPRVVRLRATSDDDPAAELARVGEYRAPEAEGAWRIPFDPPLKARYLELSILENFGSGYLNIGELRVLEARRPGYRSVLARAREEELARRGRSGPALETAALPEADRIEREPNDTPAEATPLTLGASMAGRIDPLGERDHFRLAVPPEAARPLLLEMEGYPQLKTRLELEGEGGDSLLALDPGRARRTVEGSLDLGPGSYLLRLFEPRTRIVLLVDVSGSMEDRIDDARRAVLRYAAGVQPQEEMAIVKFSNSPELLAGFTSDGEALVAAARDAIEIGGGTALYDALADALDRLRDYPGNRAIVLLSDGADSRSSLSYPAIRERLAEAGVRFYAIALGEGMWTYSDTLGTTPGRMLAYLARSTGGRRYLTPSSSELLRLYEDIARELRAGTRYRLRVAPSAGTGRLVVRQTGERITGVGTPDKIHFIFDASGSMRGRDAAGQRKIAVARTVLRKLVAGLPDEVMIGLRVYGHRYPRKPKDRSCTDSQLVVPFQRVDKEAFARFVDSIEPKGQTPIGLSLRRVAEDFGDTPGSKIVVLITDGEETCSPDPEDPDYPPRVVEELLAQGLDVKVNIIGFDIEKDEVRAFLSDLAARTGGVFYGADNAAELEKALEDALKAPYEVRDMLGNVIARGTLDGGAIEVPAGVYRVEVAASSPLVMEGVRIEAGRETRLDVNKEGSEIAVDRSIGAPGTPLAGETGTTSGSETAAAASREVPAGGQAPRRPPSATSPPAASPPATSSSGTAATVARLLEEAERLFEQKKLTKPEGESALSRYRAVLALDPDNETAKEGIRRIVATYVEWARAAGERGDARKQLAYLERAISADPRNADLLFIYGGTLMDLERYAEAAEAFERAASLLSDPTEARFFAGMARLNADQPEKALAHFSQVRRAESEYRHQAGYFEGGVLFGLDRYDEAYDVLSATLRAKGDCETAPLDELCTDLWTLTVYVLRMMDREDVIMETMVGVLDLEPASPDLHDAIAEVFRANGREEEARRIEARRRELFGG